MEPCWHVVRWFPKIGRRAEISGGNCSGANFPSLRRTVARRKRAIRLRPIRLCREAGGSRDRYDLNDSKGNRAWIALGALAAVVRGGECAKIRCHGEAVGRLDGT